MASNKLVVSDFDFDNVKSNLKTFLQNQPDQVRESIEANMPIRFSNLFT